MTRSPLPSLFHAIAPGRAFARRRFPAGWLSAALALLLPATSLVAVANESAGTAPSGLRLYRCRPGPWGDVRYSRILIEPPDEFLAEDYAAPSPIRWIFPGYTDEQLTALWGRAGLSAGQVDELARCTQRRTADTPMVISPAAAFVRELSTRARTVIYSALAAFPENPNQQEPFRFRADSEPEWFEDSDLAPATLKLVRQLLYRRGNSLLFSDPDVVLPTVGSRTERLRLIKTLARKSTLLVELRVDPSSSVASISEYWGHGPRRKDVRSLLQSISRRPEGGYIDIAHLLPRFARSRLYTYPYVADHAGDANYDCHWTSLNFFNDSPDDRYADTTVVQHTLETAYVRVREPYLLGDVLVFFRPDGKAIHSCVYLADDIVFTKNGSSQVMPWMLMSLPDVIAYYPSDPPLRVEAFRQRNL